MVELLPLGVGWGLCKARHTPCNFRRHDDRRLWRRRTTIVEWPAHTMRRSSNDRTHYATAVGCTHDGRQQLKLIANLADIFLYQEEEEYETLFNYITLVIGPTFSYNFNIVHFVIVGILNKDNCVNNNTNSIRSCFLASHFHIQQQL